MTNNRTLPTRPRAPAMRSAHKPPAMPRHLQAPERALWRDLVRDFTFNDVASLALLRSALEAHQRARRCRVVIDREGMTMRDRFGQVRAHPLLGPERDARAAFLAMMRALNLDLGVPT